MPEIDILIKAVDQASAPAKTVDTALKNMGTTAKDTSTKMGGMSTVASGVGNVLKAGLTTAIVGVGAALGGLVFAFGDSVSIAKNAIAVDKQLEQVLKSTGGAAGVTEGAALDLADALMKVTNFDDEAIKSGESLLLTFTGIGKDVFPRATETMLDMSQALGQDLKSSAIQLGKALNDPINGITALSRVGVSFTEQQKEMIKTMQKAGDVAGAQGVILDELGKEFGGSARALADPMIELQNTWDNFKELIGRAILPLFNNLAKTALPMVQSAMEITGKITEDFFSYFDNGVGIVESVKGVLGDLLPADQAAKWTGYIAATQGTFNTLTGIVQNAVGWIRLAWDTDWAGIHTTWTTFATAMPGEQQAFWEAWHGVFATNSKQNVNDWQGFFGDVFSFATGWWTLFLTNFTLFAVALKSSNKLWLDLTKGDWTAVWGDIKTIVNSATDIILNNIEYVFGPGLRDKVAFWLNATWNVLKKWWDDVSSWWNNTIGPFLGQLGAVPGLPQIPQFAPPAPAVPGQDKLPSNGATISGLGGIAITQHFYGQTDAATVHDAANNGVLTAARSMGLR